MPSRSRSDIPTGSCCVAVMTPVRRGRATSRPSSTCNERSPTRSPPTPATSSTRSPCATPRRLPTSSRGLGRRAPRRRELVGLPRVPSRRPEDVERRGPAGARERDRSGDARRARAVEPRRRERWHRATGPARTHAGHRAPVRPRRRAGTSAALGTVAGRTRRTRDRRHRDVARRLPVGGVEDLEGGARSRRARPAVDPRAGALDR